MTLERYLRILQQLHRAAKKWQVPVVTLVANTGQDPYRVLVSCVLSLRTKDETTAVAVKKLFGVASTPKAMLKLSVKQLEKLIYPVGFYHTKAQAILKFSREIVEKYRGEVPSTLEELLSFKGVGLKTANLVLSEGFGKPAICVDVHVHRIHNRLDFVQTNTPHETEAALRKKVPDTHWKNINATFVAFGQYLCRPISPRCSICPIHKDCPRRGVTSSR